MELDLGLNDVQSEQEPTVLEFARFHGLCKNYATEHLLPGTLKPPPDEVLDQDLRDPLDAPTLTNRAYELTKERLTINKESAFLLKSVFSFSEPLNDDAFELDEMRIRELKQEVPLLRSDNELDLLNFGSTTTPSFNDTKIPLEPLNEENEESLEWPEKYYAFPALKNQWAITECSRLAMKRDDLCYLQDAIKDTYRPEYGEEIIEECLQYNRSAAVGPLTPPLLPLSPPVTPYLPSSPANHLELLSEDSNSTAAEAKAFENQIMGADTLITYDSNGSEQMLLDMTENMDSSPGFGFEYPRSIIKRKAEDLKVETPLTPPMFSTSPAKKLKTVTFSDFPDYIENLASLYDNGDENGDDDLRPEDEFTDFYKEFEPLAEKAKWRVENESLSEADTTKRVEVPMVDFTLPIAPWEMYTRRPGDSNSEQTELDAQRKFILRVKRELAAGSWHGAHKLDRELRLDPFPSRSTSFLVETLHGEENISKLLSELTTSDIVTSSSNLWKRDVLQILEEDEEDEEELDPLEVEEQKDVDALIRKRKVEMDQAAAESNWKRQHSPEHHAAYRRPGPFQQSSESPDGKKEVMVELAVQQRRHKLPKTRQKKTNVPHKAKESGGSLMFGGRFSATNAMDNFMAMQGMKAKPLKGKGGTETTSSHFSAPPRTLPIRPTSPKPQTVVPTVVPPKLPRLPSIPRDLPPCSFIISSTLLQQRHLSKQIEKLYPEADFVSRDFDLPNLASEEADLLLSPSTGLILTTLQEVKQRALPGQPDRSKLKARIVSLQSRYERLVVVVSEGLSREMEERGSGRPVDDRDLEAITELERFATKMEGDVPIQFVPGGDQALARSIVCEMAKYGLPHGSRDIGDIKLLPDETNWESFLRRAGLNPFAAQVILAWLKDNQRYPLPLSSPTSSEGPLQLVVTFGLQTLLMMSPQQRIEQFQALMGGCRVLERVNALLDQEWVSAAHGYRM